MLQAGPYINRKLLSSILYPYMVCFLWGIGLLLGWHLAELNPPDSLSLMRMLRVEYVSIVPVLMVQLLPFVISVLIFTYASAYFILPVVLLKAVLYGYCGSLLSLIFGDASWLVVGLILFSGTFSSPLLLWFWLSAPNCKGRNDRITVLVIGAVLLMLGIIDYFAVSPFWEALLY